MVLDAVQTAAFVLGPQMSESVYKAFKRRLSVPHSLLGLLDVSPIGFHSQTFWRLLCVV